MPARSLSHEDEDTGATYLYRPGEILVADDDLALLAGGLRRARARFVRHLPGALLFRIPKEDRVPSVVDTLRRQSPGASVAPNHVLHFAFHDIWCPMTAPEPAEPLPELEPRHDELPGTGVTVGVIDTGLENHPWFDGRARRARRGTADAEEHHDGSADALDFEAGHGTHVAGIILQSAPGADVVVYGVADAKSHLDDVELVDALSFMVDKEAVDVLNLSFGGLTDAGQPGLMATRRALQAARRRRPGIVIVAAAGNRSEDEAAMSQFFPACESGVIGVAALESDGETPAPFSNTGAFVRTAAVGRDVTSTFLHWNGLAVRTPPHLQHRHDGPEVPTQHSHDGLAPKLETKHFKGWATWSGTSFAAPQVAGSIAAAMSPAGVKLTSGEAVDTVLPRNAPALGEGLGVRANLAPIKGLMGHMPAPEQNAVSA